MSRVHAKSGPVSRPARDAQRRAYILRACLGSARWIVQARPGGFKGIHQLVHAPDQRLVRLGAGHIQAGLLEQRVGVIRATGLEKRQIGIACLSVFFVGSDLFNKISRTGN